MALSGTHTNWVHGSYEADRNVQIKVSENHPLHNGDLTKLNAHIDGKNRLALAYGYDLLVNINTLVNDLTPFVTSLKAGMSTVQALEKVKSIVLNPDGKTISEIRDEVNTYFTFGSEANATLLLNKTIAKFETALDNKLGSHTLPLSRERAAMISQIYRLGPEGAPSLMRAIIEDNRAEAWFEIRFNSNADKLPGNYIRVVAESNMFGLYDEGGITEKSAKEIMAMYTQKENRKKIFQEEKAFPAAYSGQNAIINQIKLANDYLQNLYDKGIGGGELIEGGGGVIVGAGWDEEYAYDDFSFNDTDLEGTEENDLVFLEKGSDAFHGYGEDDVIYAGDGSDTVYGDIGDDFLIGEKGIDYLYGGEGDDTLFGMDGYGTSDNGEADTLNGGVGYDTYISGNNDVIYDADGSGMIVFEGRLLHGVDVTQDSTIYPSNQDHTAYYSKTDKGTYTRNGNSGFRFVSDSGKTLTVHTPLDYTEKIIPKPGGGTMTQKTYRGVGVTLENFSSPLVLDLNHDGVTSLDLYATPAYFDMEGDGIREKTGWIQSTDALLAFDKNRDGIINDGSELFGNNTILANGTKASNGFEALAQYDNNRDGTIDTNDAIYHALSAWIDTDQDGVTDTGELHTLTELGVTSINLNATATTAYEDQNAISHTSSFTQQTTDTQGNTITETKTVNDVWFKSEIKRKVA